MCFPKKHHGHRAWWHHLFKQTSVIPAWEQLKPSAAALHHNTKKWPPVPAVTWVKLHISECCISNPLALAANCVGMNIAGSLGVGIVLPGSSSLSTTAALGSRTVRVYSTPVLSPVVKACFPGTGQAVRAGWSIKVSPQHCSQLRAALTQGTGAVGSGVAGWAQALLYPLQTRWNTVSKASPQFCQYIYWFSVW